MVLDDTWRWVRYSATRQGYPVRRPDDSLKGVGLDGRGWTDGVVWFLRTSGLVESRDCPGPEIDFEVFLPTRAEDIEELTEAVRALDKIRSIGIVPS